MTTINVERAVKKMQQHALELRRRDIDLHQALPQIQKFADEAGWQQLVGHPCTVREATLLYESAIEPDVDITTFHQTDSGSAEFFAHLNKGKLCNDHKRGRWLIFRGHWWAEDADGLIYRLATDAARIRLQAALQLRDSQGRRAQIEWALESESRSCIHAMLDLAKNNALLADDGEHWDSDPMLLGVKNGVIDLRTGKLREGRPEDQITMHTNVPFDPEAKAPRWERFISEIFGGDQELADYVQRSLGYCLTGSTREQCIFEAFGPGGNGKTTLLEGVRHVLGPYAANVPFSAFDRKARAAIPNDEAHMAGRRLVTASEVNESVELNEARIKSWSGGDKQTGRRLYENLAEFIPTAKIWLSVNHRPVIRDDSWAMWRRIRLIPFNQIFRGRKDNKKLLEELQAEALGILAWLVRGCLEWQKHGLGAPPKAVKDATEAYRKESDVIGEFIADCCEVGEGRMVSSAALRERYEKWASENPEYPRLDHKAFASRLESKGFKRDRLGRNRTRIRRGLSLKSISTEDVLVPVSAAAADAPLEVK